MHNMLKKRQIHIFLIFFDDVLKFITNFEFLYFNSIY
jgi:hypothetical protein